MQEARGSASDMVETVDRGGWAVFEVSDDFEIALLFLIGGARLRAADLRCFRRLITIGIKIIPDGSR